MTRGNTQPFGATDAGESPDLLLRAVAAAVPAEAVALLVPDGSGLRLIAQDGLDPRSREPLIAHLEHVLRAAAGGERMLPDGIVPVPGAPGLCMAGAAAPFGADGDRDAGLLVALGDAPDAVFDARQSGILSALAGLAARVLKTSRGTERDDARLEDIDGVMAEALEALPEALAVYDREGRFVFWNRRFAETYSWPGVVLQRGRSFAAHLETAIARGQIPEAVGRERDWLKERLARFAAVDGVHEHQLANGRWVRVQDRPLPHGGTIGIRSDITDIRERERSFKLLFDANPTPMFVAARDTLGLLAANDAALAFYGYDREAFLRLTVPDIRVERSVGEVRSLIDHVDDPSVTEDLRIHRTATGEERIVKVSLRTLDHAGRPAVLASVFDMTERHRMEEEIRQTRAFLRDVIDQVPLAVYAKDMWSDGRYVIYNKEAERLVGRERAQIVGRSDRDVFEPADAARFAQQDLEVLQGAGSGLIDEESVHRPDGTPRWIRTHKIALADAGRGTPRYVLGVSEDITDRRASEARIAHMAHHDALTDLPNRFLLDDRLQAALARLPGSSELLALLYIDLDGFKAVNDASGHANGDRLLCAVADRLRGALRVSDTVARLGGDEFVILQTPLAQVGEAAWLAGRVISLLSHPYDLAGRSVKVGASIGICIAPADGLQAATLLASADAALYEAKRGGRSRFRFVDAALNSHADDRTATSLTA